MAQLDIRVGRCHCTGTAGGTEQRMDRSSSMGEQKGFFWFTEPKLLAVMRHGPRTTHGVCVALQRTNEVPRLGALLETRPGIHLQLGINRVRLLKNPLRVMGLQEDDVTVLGHLILPPDGVTCTCCAPMSTKEGTTDALGPIGGRPDTAAGRAGCR